MQIVLNTPATYQPVPGAAPAMDAGGSAATIPLNQYQIIRRNGAGGSLRAEQDRRGQP